MWMFSSHHPIIPGDAIAVLVEDSKDFDHRGQRTLHLDRFCLFSTTISGKSDLKIDGKGLSNL